MKTAKNEDSEEAKEYIEVQKVAFDYIKHITTLDTGSIILLTILLEKFIKTPQWSFLIPLTFIGFILSIVALTLTALGILYSLRTPNKTTKGLSKYTAWTFILGLLFFLMGIVSISILVIKNWS
jgi:F0F1-type ATP synthase assembly protein I